MIAVMEVDMRLHKIAVNMMPYWMMTVSYVLVVISTPMPANPGWVEVAMGMGLLSSCLLLAVKMYRNGVWANREFIIVALVMSYLIVIPLMTGILNGHNEKNILRDLAPALFLIIIPLTIKYSLEVENLKNTLQLLLSALLFVGVVSVIHNLIWVHQAYGSFNNFALQMSGSFERAAQLVVNPESQKVTSIVNSAPQDLYQLSVLKRITASFPNDFKSVALLVYEPAVLFSAIYSLLSALEMLSRHSIIRAILWIIVASICTYTLSVWGSRASVSLIFFAGLLFMMRRINFTLRAVSGALIIGSFVAILGLTVFSDVISMLIVKQHSVGTNGKVGEFIAVMDQSRRTMPSFLFGGGWGEELINPVYISAPTRFTHSLISFLLLKVGIVGLAAFIWLYLHSFLKAVSNIVFCHSSVFIYKLQLASVLVLLVGLALQPTYKMLGFSIVLAILSACVTNKSYKGEHGE